MVKIRLARSGAKKRPFYHVVVTDQRRARDGRYIERLGFFNPVAIGGEVPLRINVERVEYWQGRGAQASERVMHLVKHFAKHGEQAAPARAAPSKSKAKPKPAPAKAADAAAAKAEQEAPEAQAPEKEEAKAPTPQAQAEPAEPKPEPSPAEAKASESDATPEKQTDKAEKDDAEEADKKA